MNNHNRLKKAAPFIKWGVFSLLALVLYLIQVTPGFLQFGMVKPAALCCLPLLVALYEDVFGSAVFGCLCGLLWDTSAGVPFGFFGLFLLVFCVLISLFVRRYLRINTLTAALVTALGVGFTLFMNYLFLYALWGYSGMPQLFVKSLIPTVLISLPFFLPVLPAVRGMERWCSSIKGDETRGNF